MIWRALVIAKGVHKGIKRKYTGRPYIEHPARVAAHVSIHPRGVPDIIAAAWLHDVLEDENIDGKLMGYDELANKVGTYIAGVVREVTNPSKGSKESREVRKKMDRDHLAGVSKEAKIIKMLDRIDNLYDMLGATEKFKLIYYEESMQLGEVIRDADEVLGEELLSACQQLLR